MIFKNSYIVLGILYQDIIYKKYIIYNIYNYYFSNELFMN